MKKNLSRITILLLILSISIGVSYAANWTPGAAPGDSIVPPPITALDTDQVKPGSLSVNTFAALGNGRLKQDALFAGVLQAVGTDPNLKFRIGGTSSTGQLVHVDTTVSGNVTSGKTLGSSELRNTTLNPLCTDGSGHIIFCGQAPLNQPSGSITFDNACNGSNSTSTIHAKVGDVVVLRLSFSGILTYNTVYTMRAADINLTVAGQSIAGSTPTYTYPADGSSNGFSVSKEITFTMTSPTMPIATSLVTKNSTNSTSNGSLSIVSINGVASSASNSVCTGNSQGSF
jgi:hypothetical protein